MDSTIQLIDRALKQRRTTDPEASERSLSKELGLSHSALAVAKTRGNLSPLAAGQLAEMLGEDVRYWMSLANIEAAPKSRLTERLRRAIDKARNS